MDAQVFAKWFSGLSLPARISALSKIYLRLTVNARELFVPDWTAGKEQRVEEILLLQPTDHRAVNRVVEIARDQHRQPRFAPRVKPFHLAQFAVMGNIYSREVLGRKNPRVGVLSIGTEECKGNDLTLEAFKLCKKLDLNFIGNVEGHDLFKDHVDVVVCDGFIGNIVLKTSESLAVAMFSMLKRELMHTAQRKLGAFLAKGAFHAIRKRMDPEVYGGAPMLGFSGLVFKAHASARERAIASAIRVTADAVQHRVNETIALEITEANKKLSAAQTVPA